MYKEFFFFLIIRKKIVDKKIFQFFFYRGRFFPPHPPSGQLPWTPHAFGLRTHFSKQYKKNCLKIVWNVCPIFFSDEKKMLWLHFFSKIFLTFWKKHSSMSFFLVLKLFEMYAEKILWSALFGGGYLGQVPNVNKCQHLHTRI